MKPALGESVITRALEGMTHEDLDREIERAEILLRDAETYLAWLKMTRALTESAGLFVKAQWRAMETEREREHSVRPARTVPLPPVSRELGERRPALRRAILMVMATDAARVWKKKEIFDSLRQRGWEPSGQKPSAQLATRLSEMVERKEIERLSVGHYRLTNADTFRADDARDKRPQEGGEEE